MAEVSGVSFDTNEGVNILRRVDWSRDAPGGTALPRTADAARAEQRLRRGRALARFADDYPATEPRGAGSPSQASPMTDQDRWTWKPAQANGSQLLVGEQQCRVATCLNGNWRTIR